MATTAQSIFDRAGNRSNLNDTSLIPAGQLLAYLNTFQRFVYMTAARLNPDFFGTEGSTAARATASATWDISSAGTPTDVGAVSKVEVAAITGTISGVSVGTQVNLVSIRNPDVALAPRAYLRNRTIQGYSSELGANDSNFVTTLKLYYSIMPAALASAASNLTLPDELDNLVVLPLARVMAIRDQRPDEVPAIDAEFMIHWQTFIQHLSVYDEAAVRELEQIAAAYHQIASG